MIASERDCQDVAVDATPKLAEDAADLGSEESPLVAVVRLTGDGAGHDDELRWGRERIPCLTVPKGMRSIRENIGHERGGGRRRSADLRESLPKRRRMASTAESILLSGGLSCSSKRESCRAVGRTKPAKPTPNRRIPCLPGLFQAFQIRCTVSQMVEV